MVSNYERIYREIRTHTKLHEDEYGMNSNDLILLVMEIVDIEDRNRIKPLSAINKRIANMIDQAAKSHARQRGEV